MPRYTPLATGCQTRASGVRAEADRAAHTGAAQTAIAAGILGQVLLVVILCVVELGRRQDLGGDHAVAGGGQPLLIGVARRLGGTPIGVVVIVDAGPVLGADV